VAKSRLVPSQRSIVHSLGLAQLALVHVEVAQEMYSVEHCFLLILLVNSFMSTVVKSVTPTRRQSPLRSLHSVEGCGRYSLEPWKCFESAHASDRFFSDKFFSICDRRRESNRCSLFIFLVRPSALRFRISGL
jgi:hypothetical protein